MVPLVGEIERAYERSWDPLRVFGMIRGALEVTLI